MALVIPSIYDDGSGRRQPFDGNSFSSTKLRVGQVIAMHPPGDDYNMNGRVIEYQVKCQYTENGTGLVKLLDHCVVGELFGGGADTLTYTLRPDEQQLNLGSQVLVLHINGEQINGIILSGIRNSQSDKDNEDLGHNLKFRFNGVEVTIDKDGQLSLTVGGAMDIRGNIASPIGTTIMVDTSGNVTLNSPATINVIADKVMLGDKDLEAMTQGVVLGRGVDSFTGSTYAALQSTSKNVMAKD